MIEGSRHAVVGIATSYRSDGPGFEFQQVKKFFVLQILPEVHWGPHSLPFNEHRGTFLGIKRTGSCVDHSPPPRGEIKNGWSYNIIPPILSWHGQGMDGFVEQICPSSGDSGLCRR